MDYKTVYVYNKNEMWFLIRFTNDKSFTSFIKLEIFEHNY